MSSVYRSTLAALAGSAAVAFLIGLIDAAWGWAAFAICLLAMLLYQFWTDDLTANPISYVTNELGQTTCAARRPCSIGPASPSSSL